MSLSTRVGKRSRKVQNERASVPYGRAVTVLGRLTSTDGAPLARPAGRDHRACSARRAPRRRPSRPCGPTRPDASRSRSPPARAAPSASATPAPRRSCTARARSPCASPRARPIRASRASLRGAGAVRFSGRLRDARRRAAARAARSSISRPPRAAAGRPSRPPAPAAPRAPGSAVARFRGTPGTLPGAAADPPRGAVPVRTGVLARRRRAGPRESQAGPRARARSTRRATVTATR